MPGYGSFGTGSSARPDARVPLIAEMAASSSSGSRNNSSSSSSTSSTSKSSYAEEVLTTTTPSSSVYPSGKVGGEGGRFFIDRVVLLAALDRRADRARRCRSVPASLAVYAAFVGALMGHAQVEPAYDFETSLVTDVVYASGFADTVVASSAWYDWAALDLLPTLLPPSPDAFARALAASDGDGESSSPRYLLQGGNSKNPLSSPSLLRDPSGRVLNNYGLVVGGIRLIQTRAAKIDCLDSSVRLVYNDSCYDQSQTSDAPFGNITAAQEYGVESAFFPSSTPGDAELGTVFQLYIDALSDSSQGASAIDGLQMGGWIDEATKGVRVQVVVLNGQIDHFGVVDLSAEFKLGGRVATLVRVGSFSASPYTGPEQQWLFVLDAVVIIYALYLARSLFMKCASAYRRHDSKGGHRGGWCVRLASTFTPWRILDIGALTALITTIATWVAFCVKVTDIRDKIARDAAASPATYSGSAHADTAADAFSAYQLHQTAKVAAVIGLIFLSLRLFKYFQFQPRLAVMTDSLAMAASDAVHFGLLFAVLLCCYGTWGHTLFGTQAPDWSDTNNSIVSVFRYMMYDYDLPAMYATFPNMANFFNASFMLVVTNMTLWMFLAIILESHTDIRAKSHDAPSVIEETTIFLKGLPAMVAVPKWMGGSNVRQPTWAELHIAVKDGPLRDLPTISPGDLQRGVGLDLEGAIILIKEAQKEASKKHQEEEELRIKENAHLQPINQSHFTFGGSGSNSSTSAEGGDDAAATTAAAAAAAATSLPPQLCEEILRLARVINSARGGNDDSALSSVPEVGDGSGKGLEQGAGAASASASVSVSAGAAALASHLAQWAAEADAAAAARGREASSRASDPGVGANGSRSLFGRNNSLRL